MENKKNQDQDFTSKGRTSNVNEQQNQGDSSTDISNVDQQEGEMNHGTTSNDQHLFQGEEEKSGEQSQ